MTKTIKLGVDLGTTNSSIVLNKDGTYEIIKNSDGIHYTPSVFGYNRGKNPQVGKKAYESIFTNSSEDNNQNYKAEIKRLMGTTEKISFPRVDKDMSPEEISAEILKFLKEAVLRKHPNIDTIGVVITVPAYFDTVQKEATIEAGKIAGFKHVVLIQEPIAASLAYGFDDKTDQKFLVYDLGGGTFDVAIMSSKGGSLTVKGHKGDNFLGGKDFDSAIVEEIILPKLREEFSIKNLNINVIGNKLKYYAESAKKELTNMDSTTIIVDDERSIIDDNGEPIYCEIEVTREDFNNVIESFIHQSIDLCEEAIEESGYSKDHISRIILVGGSTQVPYVREELKKHLGIEVDSSVDPLTVVAKGACIFGSSKIIPEELYNQEEKEVEKEKKGELKVELDYESMVSDDDTLVSGIIPELKGAEKDYYIQIASDDGTYSGNKIKLKKGKFFDNILVGEGTNNYSVYLSENGGTSIKLNPNRFSISKGLSIAGTPLSHSVSVVLRKTSLVGEGSEYCDKVFERGSILPLKSTKTYYTVADLTKGDNKNVLPIKIVEGESVKPDRNTEILRIQLEGNDVPYELPAETEVNLTINIDESGKVLLEAYIPSIDFYKSGESLRTHGWQEDDSQEYLLKQIDKIENSYNGMKNNMGNKNKEEIKKSINEIKEQISRGDTDSRMKSTHQIKELKKKLDNIESDLMADSLTEKFNSVKENIDSSDDFQVDLKDQCEKAIDSENWEKLSNLLEQLETAIAGNLFNNLEGLKALLLWMYENKQKLTNRQKGEKLFQESLTYMENNNVDGMKNVVQKLGELFPEEDQSSLSGLSGLVK